MIMNAHDARLKTESAIKERESAHDKRANVLYHSILKAVETSADVGNNSVRVLWPSSNEPMGICQAINHTTYEGEPALTVSDRAELYIKCVPDVCERLEQAGFTVKTGRNEHGDPTISQVSW